MKVYLVTKGDGSDGDEWYVLAIFSTKEGAERYVKDHNAHRPGWARVWNPVEEWDIDKEFDPTGYLRDPAKELIARDDLRSAVVLDEGWSWAKRQEGLADNI